MDTTEIYIAQCDCLEIQYGWELKPGDVLYSSTWYGPVIVAHCGGDPLYKAIDAKGKVVSFGNEMEWIALPRQDQIFEWLKKADDLEFVRLKDGRWELIYSLDEHGGNIVKGTVEQCLIQVYMHEKHSLDWVGEKWE